MTKEDFIIHELNNLQEEYGIILVGLENCLMSLDIDAPMIKVICEKKYQV